MYEAVSLYAGMRSYTNAYFSLEFSDIFSLSDQQAKRGKTPTSF